VFVHLSVIDKKDGNGAMLFQIHDRSGHWGSLGVAGATAISWAGSIFGHLINVAILSSPLSIFLLLFMAQIAILFHELSEAQVLPNSEVLHDAT